MAVDTERRAKKSASRLGRSLLLQPVTDAMSFHSQTHDSAENSARGPDSSSLPSPGDHISSSKPTVTGRELGNHHSSSKMRRSSKGKVPGELRRSTSTPHMRNLALGSADELSPTSNKPRNKLGYHRTSVACGHCRRRKIRCLLAPDDPRGRCANCIRLKKECNFYPVEHNPDEPPSHSVAAKDTTPGLPLTPADSSPRHPPSLSGEKLIEFRAPYRGTCSTTPNPSYGFPGDSEVDSNHTPSSSRMPVQQPTYPFPHPIDTQWPAATTFLPSSTIAESPSSSTSYWRQSPSTANSAYGSESNVSGGHTPATMSTSSTMSYGHADHQSWSAQPQFQPPARSMSYGHIEGLSQPYPGQGLGIQHPDFARRNSPYPYPTSIDTTSSAMHATTMGGSTCAPLSAPVVPNQYFPPTWHTYEGLQSQGQQMQMPGRSMSVQWYSEPGHLDRVQEEGPPPVGYNSQTMQQFYPGA